MTNFPSCISGPHAAGDEQLTDTVTLIEQLVEANLRSLHIARRLLRAQEVADAESLSADKAVNRAVELTGDAEAIDAAVAAVRTAQAAAETEEQLSYSWAVHRCDVSRLAQTARALIAAQTASAVQHQAR